MHTRLAKFQIVLVGIGHTNAHIVRMWKMQPIPNCQLVCVSDYPIATYSGMLPGVLSGQYQPKEMEIDLVRLCRSAGCRLVISEFASIDRENRRIRFPDRADLEYDWLSIGIGSRPSFEGVTVDDPSLLVPIKPMQSFLRRLSDRLETVGLEHSRPARCMIVGGGLGSIETALCLTSRAKKRGTPSARIMLDEAIAKTSGLEISLVTASSEPGKGMTASAVRRIESALRAAGVRLVIGERVTRISGTGVTTQSGKEIPADLVIWATAAIARSEMESTGLELDERGFARIKSTLQSVNDDRIFAVGDSGTLVDSPTDKAGVFAVRQGPVLWENLNQLAIDRPPIKYFPQQDFLKLVNLGDGTAIGQIRGRYFGGRFAWWLKDRIDRKFMGMYQDYAIDSMMASPVAEPDQPGMRCLGCGGKVGGQLLHAALAEIDWSTGSDVVDFEAAKSDDAAIIRTDGNEITVSTDFFASPVDDPWLAGRISVLNSISDLYVMGARPTAALALVQIVEGHPRGQLRMLRELMAGTAHELRKSNTAMAGGHTIEGERLAIGFTVIGRQELPPQKKSGLKPGDLLILSKPLGSGTILAGMMQNLVDGRVFHEFAKTLTVGNAIAIDIARVCKLSAMTDVTGFGLAGHLSEMLRASGVSAELDAEGIPMLDGFVSLVTQQVASTLAPGNREFSVPVRYLSKESPVVDAAMFDPQTCGGILLGCESAQAEEIIDRLQQAGHRAAVIGTVVTATEQPEILVS